MKLAKNVKAVMARTKSAYLTACQSFGAVRVAPSEKQARVALFVFGVAILALGLTHEGMAQGMAGGTKYNDSRIANAVNAIMTYLEGSFGALVMAASGIGAILSAAFGNFKAALSLMVVAVGAFVLRSFMSTFFNDISIQQ
jgi:hypothetical protein